MAHRFEKGKHIYILFKNGFTVQDSQLKPRYYLERKRAEVFLPYGDEIVEYAPVVHGRWTKFYKSGNKVNEGWVSSCCDMWNERKSPYCPNCGARMDGE